MLIVIWIIGSYFECYIHLTVFFRFPGLTQGTRNAMFLAWIGESVMVHTGSIIRMQESRVEGVLHLLGSGTLSPDITLLGNGELGTLALGERDPGLGALTDDEDVGDTNEG